MKRVLALVLCFCILFSLTACKDKKEDVGFVKLFADTLSMPNSDIKCTLSISIKDVDNVALFLASQRYLKEKGTLSGFGAVKEDYVKNSKEFVVLVNGLFSSSLSMNGALMRDSGYNLFYDGDIVVGEGKNLSGGNIGVYGSSLFVDYKTLLGLYENYLSASLSPEELTSVISSFSDAESYVKFSLNDFDTVDFKNDASKIVSIRSYLNKFVSNYCSSFVSTVSDTKYSLSFNVNDLKSYMSAMYDLVKENPGDFYDCAKDLVIASKGVGLFESFENELMAELLDTTVTRSDFTKKWKSVSFDDFYSSVITSEIEELLDLYAGSSVVLSIDNDFNYSIDLNIAINSSSALVIKSDGLISSNDSNTNGLSEFDGAVHYSTFADKLSKALKGNDSNVVIKVEESEVTHEDIYSDEKVEDSDALINVVPLVSIGGLASKLDLYNIVYRGMEQSEFKDYIYSDFTSIASKVGFNLDTLKEVNTADSYEVSVSSEDTNLSMKISPEVGKLSYTILVPRVKPLITLQGWLKDVETITGLSLGNAYIVDILKLAEDDVVSEDYLSYNMTSINDSLEYLITYTENESVSILTFNIYTYLF